MDITIQSKIYPNIRHRLICINQGTHYEIRYAGADPCDSPVGVVYTPFLAADDVYDELCDKVREVCKRSGDVFEVVPTAPRAREVTLFIVGGYAHAVRVDRMDRANRYTEFADHKRLQRIMRVIERNNVPVLLAID